MNVASNAPPSPSVDDMPPTEKTFLRVAESIRESLETFQSIVEKGSSRVVYCCILELVSATVSLTVSVMHSFVLKFLIS